MNQEQTAAQLKLFRQGLRNIDEQYHTGTISSAGHEDKVEALIGYYARFLSTV